jgi:hypothetical protein
MRFRHLPDLRRSGCVLAAAAVVALFVSGCGASPQHQAATATRVSAKVFDPANFDRSATVDNEWLPLRPGTQLVFVGSTKEENSRVPHRLVSTVTDLTKVVNGVRGVMIWERDYTEGKMVEAELALFAQDKAGNVWHLGQYPEEYEKGKFVRAPAWLAGVKGARAGVVMRADPRAGTPGYAQGYAPPPVNWVDRAKVYRQGVKTCVPAGCYRNVLVIREFETGKPDAFQVKYYARGLGNVRVGWAGSKDKDNEVLILTKVVHLTPAGLRNARAEALKMEKHAYARSKGVYGHSQPAAPR